MLSFSRGLAVLFEAIEETKHGELLVIGDAGNDISCMLLGQMRSNSW